MSRLSLIVAVSENHVIGKDNHLPWRLSADLRYFKQRTMGKPIVMGRKTWQSIGKALPGRDNIVITGDADFSAPGAIVVDSYQAAIEACGDAKEIMIIGGGSIYAAALEDVERVYLTRVHLNVSGGDTYFHWPDARDWQISCEHFVAGEGDDPDCTFLVYDLADSDSRAG